MLEGWRQEGDALIKWFGDHYKWAPNEEVAAALDQEHALRNPVAPEAPAETPVAPAAEDAAPLAEAAPATTEEAGAAPAADASDTTTEGQ